MGSAPHQDQPPPLGWAAGNPWLERPHLKGEDSQHSSKNGDLTVHEIAVPDNAAIHRAKDRKPKKLVVLCDGTGQDSYGSVAKNPTNIARMARALAPNAFVLTKKPDGVEHYVEWEQLISYHSGVGTFDGNALLGGMFGEGLSEIVRAAYGFLVNNYSAGDKIYIFGFSRGAYIARALAGLVSNYGLLTKRGMDNFNAVYETFYAKDSDGETSGKRVTVSRDVENAQYSKKDNKWTITKEEAGLRPVFPGTVEVVGVFDTVGFHSPIKVWLGNNEWTKPFRKAIWGADRDEFANTQLHDGIKFAFHALSLDESRIPFQTTLWWRKKEVPKSEKHIDPITGHEWWTTLKQVWFSGRHSDIGGGMQDTRFSNVALGWMIAQLESRNLLAFNKDYLMNDSSKTTVSLPTGNTALFPDPNPWKTTKAADFDAFASAEQNSFWRLMQKLKYYIAQGAWNLLQAIKALVVFITGAGHGRLSRWFTGHRKPGEYTPIEAYRTMNFKDAALYDTFEEIHESVLGRNEPGGWDCPALKGCVPHEARREDGSRVVEWKKNARRRWYFDRNSWWIHRTPGREVTFHEHPATEPDDSVKVRRLARGIEKMFRGNMRFRKNVTPWLAHPVELKTDATPVVDPQLVAEVNPPM